MRKTQPWPQEGRPANPNPEQEGQPSPEGGVPIPTTRMEARSARKKRTKNKHKTFSVIGFVFRDIVFLWAKHCKCSEFRLQRAGVEKTRNMFWKLVLCAM